MTNQPVQPTVEDLLDKLKGKTETLNKAKEQISGGWLMIEKEKSRLLGAIDNLSLGFIITDDHNNITKANPTVEKILGRSNFGPWTIADIQKEVRGDFNLPLECIRCIRERKALEPREAAFREKFLRFFLSPIIILKESLALIGIVIVIEDITSETQTTQFKYREIETTSCQLKTYMEVIRRMSEQILNSLDHGQKNESLEKLVNNIHQESVLVEKTIDNCVKNFQLQMTDPQLKKEIFPLTGIISEVINEFEPAASKKGLSLGHYLSENTGLVIADKNKVKEILSNLLDNAINFTARGSVTISVIDGQDQVKISITDTGSGISPEAQKDLFKKSIQSEVAKGSGILQI